MTVWEEVARRSHRNRLGFYEPYPKQLEFHAAGKEFRERALIAGNQLGKTHGAANEFAMHLTGRYPADWPGHRYNRPIIAWTGSESNEASREIIQAALLGTEDADIKSLEMGTGAIPFDCIRKLTKRQAGVNDVVDQIYVKHISGGESRCVLKTYEQGRLKWQGKKIDLLWDDEEPPADIYSEGLTRLQAVSDGRMMCTFTPLKGMSDVVRKFVSPELGDAPRHYTNMTIYDALHYTDEERAEAIARYPSHERETRSMGVPMIGEGRVWPIKEDTITCDPFPIPAHYFRICGIDFGLDHPFAAAWIAWDRDTDIIYLYDSFRHRVDKSTPGNDPVAPIHASAIKKRGDWIPVTWPHDGMSRQRGGGEELQKLYRKENLRMLTQSARYADAKGGRQDVEPVVLDIYQRMLDGRFKVFSNQSEFFEEFRMYHRKDGKIVAKRDDIISAVRYAVMSKRKARQNAAPRPQTAPRAGLR